MNPRRLFIASCLALITSAFSFQVRQNIADPLAAQFSLTKEQVGGAMGAAFLGMAVAMLVFAPLCDIIGMGTVLFFAWICHLTGILGTIFSTDIYQNPGVANFFSSIASALPETIRPAEPGNTGLWVLWASTFLVGCGNGLVEIAINPLAATLFPREKTHYLNVLHAWWPGGLILSGLLILFVVNPLLHLDGDNLLPDTVSRGWKVKMAMLLVPLALYGLLCVGARFPQTERVQANVSAGTMFLQILRPMFLLWAICMLMTASTELGPNQWQESVLKRTAHVSGTLIFVYTSGLMFIMRFFAGPLAHRLSPVGLLTVSAFLSATGLYWLSYVDTPVMAFAAATIFGVGIAYFWPTMLGVTAERFPKGGAFLLGLMGCVGNVAIFAVLPQMGAIFDSYTVKNLPTSFQAKTVRTPEGAEIPVIKESPPTWVPSAIAEHIYPAGSRKLDPEAEKLLPKEEKVEVAAAEVEGARWAFRWVAVLPAILVVIFGLIALVDRLRGGYQAVHIGTAPPAPEP
jgi:MFS family permease